MVHGTSAYRLRWLEPNSTKRNNVVWRNNCWRTLLALFGFEIRFFGKVLGAWKEAEIFQALHLNLGEYLLKGTRRFD